MDLYAYAQIADYDQILKDNGIQIPRLRGIRLMSCEEPLSGSEIKEIYEEYGLIDAEQLCCCGFNMNANWAEYSQKTRRIRKRLLMYEGEGIFPTGIRWSEWHGRKRKVLKHKLKKTKQAVIKQYGVFNRYCGRPDVLYIHARIGGANWGYYGGNALKTQPWFLEKVDDAFDETYCDIYAKIDPIVIKEGD